MENVDLDLLSLFPQKGARIIGGKGSKQAQRGQQWGKELARNGYRERRKKTPFYRSPRIQPLAAHQPRYYRTACGTTVERYYLNGSGTTVVPGRTTEPTTAPNRRFCGSRSGSSHGTTAGRYYRSSGRYYRLGKNSPAKTSITFPYELRF